MTAILTILSLTILYVKGIVCFTKGDDSSSSEEVLLRIVYEASKNKYKKLLIIPSLTLLLFAFMLRDNVFYKALIIGVIIALCKLIDDLRDHSRDLQLLGTTLFSLLLHSMEWAILITGLIYFYLLGPLQQPVISIIFLIVGTVSFFLIEENTLEFPIADTAYFFTVMIIIWGACYSVNHLNIFLVGTIAGLLIITLSVLEERIIGVINRKKAKSN